MRTIELGYQFQGPWGLMGDDTGTVLHGVHGKPGVRGLKRDDTFIGADFIRIDPGCGFLPHAHEGDHILFVLEGRGCLSYDGNIIELMPGNLAFVPAEHPHAMSCPSDATTALEVLAIGHPHHEVFSLRRSYSVSESHDPRDRTPPARHPAQTHSHS